MQRKGAFLGGRKQIGRNELKCIAINNPENNLKDVQAEKITIINEETNKNK